jgi:hypothetical protein
MAAPELPRKPGWYTQPGDPTMRWWSGTEWVGQPSAINPSIIPGSSAEPRRAGSGVSGIPVGIIAASAILSFALPYFANWVSGVTASPGFVSSGSVLSGSDVLNSTSQVLIGLLTIVLAFVDRRGQLRRGQPTAASGFWILLTPIAYLAARAYHVSRYRRGAWVPFWVYLSSLLVTVAFGVVAVVSSVGLALAQYVR